MYCGELEKVKRSFYLDKTKTDYDLGEYNNVAVEIYKIADDVFHIFNNSISLIEITSQTIGGYIDLAKNGAYISEGKYNSERNSFIFDLYVYDFVASVDYNFFESNPLFFEVEYYKFKENISKAKTYIN